jgi:hypothetical protein
MLTAAPTIGSGVSSPQITQSISQPDRYDGAACHILQSVNLRLPALLQYARSAAIFRFFAAGPVPT